jgi:hypothetical protein
MTDGLIVPAGAAPVNAPTDPPEGAVASRRPNPKKWHRHGKIVARLIHRGGCR